MWSETQLDDRAPRIVIEHRLGAYSRSFSILASFSFPASAPCRSRLTCFGRSQVRQLTKSDRDSATSAAELQTKAQGLTPGCDDSVGNLKSKKKKTKKQV
jgi:hypothetical protein